MTTATSTGWVERLRSDYLEAILAADGQAATRAASRGLRGGLSLAKLYDDVIGAAMVDVGELWADRAIEVADEHAATAITHRVLATTYSLALTGNPSHEVRILLGTAVGERHSLGVRMVADVLEVAGYWVVNLGCDLPIDSLLSSIWRHQPHLVGLSSPTPGGDRLQEAVAEIWAVAPEMPVIIGGAGAPKPSGDGPVRSTKRLGDLEEAVRATLGEAPSVPRIERPGTTAMRGEPSSARDAALAETESLAELVRQKAREAVEFRQLALIDPVSGLANRRAFDDRFNELISDERSGILLMMDLDRFKQINDLYGHERGDEALADVADLLEGILRADGFAARFGGDEFAILLPDIDADTGQVVAERIRAELAEMDHDPPLTASIGLATFAGGARSSLIGADQALYAAKAAGRNAVRASPGGSLT